MMSIVVSGMIGLGKTTTSELLAEYFLEKGKNPTVFYESVEDNPILPLFYTSSKDEIQAKRYPFLLQLYFLHKRFETIKSAHTCIDPVYAIQDRSVYEDYHFARVNNAIGNISDLELQIYKNLLDNMMEEIATPPKKAPDLNIYLKASFETVLKRIGMRGRSYELSDELKDYYFALWKGYDDWLENYYHYSDVIIVDMDRVDLVNSAQDRAELFAQVEMKLPLSTSWFK